MEKTVLASRKGGTTILVSGKDKGVLRISQTLVNDLRYITDAERGTVRVIISEDPMCGGGFNSDTVIYAAVAGENTAYDRLFGTQEEIDSLKARRESFITKVIEDPQGLGRTAVFIMGSETIGTEYGLLRLSEQSGVSPWHYWGDVTPKKQEKIEIEREEIEFVSKEPSVEYRGFFLNDEWPSLGNFVTNTFGRFNEHFYDRVFDLLLRLKGNFLWPAMWAEVFAEDGQSYPQASADLATELGITMGTSHHEPLFRAREEFSYLMTDENNKGYGKDWSYYSNDEGIYRFWEDGVKRDKDHKALITIGMRGERDSLLLGEDATMKDNVDLLKKAILDQKKILRENGLADAPTVLALYKEVEDYYYGDKDTEGLNKWDQLDEALLLLSDDNFGNLRSVPDAANKDRKAGWGIYYHFDYHGDPISYEWVNSTPIRKAWEQLTSAYEYGIRRLWIANVGDLRPVELPLSYFMELAYDLEKMSDLKNTEAFTKNWVAQQFEEADDKTKQNIVLLLDDYINMNGDRRPEAIHPDTFSFTEDNEALRELKRAEDIYSRADSIRNDLPEAARDKFYGLVEFPAKGSANLRRMMILTGAYDIAKDVNQAMAERLRIEVEKTVELDHELVRRYNQEMSGGKWNGMMGSKHVNFQHWNDEDSVYPELETFRIEPSTMSIEDFLKSISKEHGDDVIVRDAKSFDRKTGDFKVIENYGKAGSSVKLYPICKDMEDPTSAPYLEYDIETKYDDEHDIVVYTAPSNNPFKGKGLRFALKIDGNDPVIIDTLPEVYNAGYNFDKNWMTAVLENGRRHCYRTKLSKGQHKIRLIHLDAGVVFQKFEISLKRSESFYGFSK